MLGEHPERPSRPLAGRSRGRFVAVVLCALLSAAAPTAAHQQAPSPPRPSPPLTRGSFLPVIRLAPDFTLTSQAEQPVHLAELRGKVVLLDFFYASCPDVCPLITGKMAALQRRLKRQGRLGKEVVLLSASFDPVKDTLEALRRYAKGAQAVPGGWFFLRGSETEITRLLQEYDLWIRPSPDGSYDHSMRIYLIDRQGRIREIYSYNFFSVEQVLLDIHSLL